MEAFEGIFVILACVILSAIIARFIPQIALPIVQIAVGLVAALALPDLTDMHIESELFLVLFIAPLLFNESRNANKPELWRNKWSILSLAIGLVLATVLIVGFFLNILVPSIPLAAAFALAGALAPTDAAAVVAMGSSVKLSPKQESQLSGESLINDASGVVSFQFAIAAAVTGVFSLVNALETFAILFIGGLLFGAVVGLSAKYTIGWMQQHGFADTRLHVVYEVFTPFAVFLAGEFIGVSGILAVVACGLVMADRAPRVTSTVDAQNAVLSNGVWSVIVFLINGVIFTLLGMQLPLAFRPSVFGSSSPFDVIVLVLLLVALIMAIRFVWVFVMNILPHKGQQRPQLRITLRSSLITTLAGPKGSVTLSIIFTIPLTLANGQAFPERDLLIFLCAGVILCTLVIANVALPLLGRADAPERLDENKVHEASVEVLVGTISELEHALAHADNRQIMPALRSTISQYHSRLARERFAMTGCGDTLQELEMEVLGVQQARANQILDETHEQLTRPQLAHFFQTLRWIRSSVGYYGNAVKVGSRPRTLRSRCAILFYRLSLWSAVNPIDSIERAKIYYKACRFQIELENTTRDYLKEVEKTSAGQRVHAAQASYEEHGAAIESIWGRLCYFEGREGDAAPGACEPNDLMEEPDFLEREAESFSKQFEMTEHYETMMDAWALTMEQEQIQRLYGEEKIDDQLAIKLHNDVYNMQMALHFENDN